MAGGEGYFQNIVLNPDGSVNYTYVMTVPGGLPSDEHWSAEEFQYGYIDRLVPQIMSGTPFAFSDLSPMWILATEVAVSQGRITAAQASDFLSHYTVNEAQGFTAFDSSGSPNISTLTLATDPAYQTALGFSGTTRANATVVEAVTQIQVASGNDPETGTPLPALTTAQENMAKMYLAAFVRAPEKEGLDYWAAKLAAGDTLKQVGDIIFSLPIVKELYADTMTNAEFAEAIYHNVFGRASDPEGLKYWTDKMAAGESRGDLVMDMINAGLGTPNGTEGKAYIENRLDAVTYAVQTQLEGGYSLPGEYLIELSKEVVDNASLATYIDSIGASNGTHQENHFVDIVGVAWHPDGIA